MQLKRCRLKKMSGICLSQISCIENTKYDLILLHKRPDLLTQCCNLLNSEWRRSETARLRSLNVSCDKFPTCLILLNKDQVIGHCRVSLIPNFQDCCIIESFVIHQIYRHQGLGSMLLKLVENYVKNLEIKNVFLMTKGQEKFYLKNGYSICESSQITSKLKADHMIQDSNSDLKNNDNKVNSGPPPPPLPNNLIMPSMQFIVASRTIMKKNLDT